MWLGGKTYWGNVVFESWKLGVCEGEMGERVWEWRGWVMKIIFLWSSASGIRYIWMRVLLSQNSLRAGGNRH